MAVTVIVGCGGGSTKTVTANGSTQPATVSQTTSTGASTSTSPTASTASLANAQSSWDDNTARLDIVKLQRSGGVTTLNVRLTNEDAEGSNSLQVNALFDDGIAQGNDRSAVDTMDGISLIDATNRKKYLAARDSSGACACDTDLGSTFVEAGQSVNLSATFGAPPPAVRTVNVFVPHFGTFKDVPIS